MNLTTMKVKKEKIIVFLMFIAVTLTAVAQENEHIDPSKPTNIYTRLNNNFEMTDLKDGTQLTGYRFNVSYALKDFQTTIEIPMLYNHKTQKAGLGDLRIRSFYVPYVDYDKTFGGLGLALDVFAPMGNPKDGISSGLWSISPGIIAGFMVSEKYSIWPVVSYRYQFGERWVEGQQQSVTQHGATLQVMNTINLSDKVYLIITPMYIQNNFANMGQFDYGGEIEFNYMLIENKLQVGCFSRQLVNSQLESYRLMVRIFL